MKFHVQEGFTNKRKIVDTVDIPLDIQKFCIWLDFFDEPEKITIVKAISHNYDWEEISKERKCLFNYENGRP